MNCPVCGTRMFVSFSYKIGQDGDPVASACRCPACGELEFPGGDGCALPECDGDRSAKAVSGLCKTHISYVMNKGYVPVRCAISIESLVKEWWALLDDGWSQRKISAEYGVSPEAVHRCMRRHPRDPATDWKRHSPMSVAAMPW